jgi:hypothetical protein
LPPEQPEFFGALILQGLAFKNCSIGIKGHNVCQDNIIFTTVTSLYSRVHGLMLLMPNPDSAISMTRPELDQAMFFRSSIVQCWRSRSHWSRFFLYLADKSGTWCSRLLQ